MAMPYMDNIQTMARDYRHSLLATVLINFELGVDTFFLLGGCLTSYTWLRSARKLDRPEVVFTPGHWLRFVRHRILRLWPQLAFCTLVTVCLAGFGTEPLWPLTDPHQQCDWRTISINLAFLNALIPNPCM